MQILPKLRTRYGEGVGVELFISQPDVNENEQTFINTDAAAAASSFTVDSALMFAVGEYILAGMFGAPRAEICRVHTSTTPTSTTLTLNANSVFAHSRGERIVFMPFNQIVIERSTDAGANYSAVETIDIRADSTETYYQHTAGASTDYYRVKFYNSASTGVSSYSDGIIATGFAENSAGYLIRAALSSVGERIDGEVLTKEFLLQALHEARKDIDQHEMIERWSFRTVFDYDFGDIIAGRYTVACPSDLRDPDTNKNILSLRVGRDNKPLRYIDKNALNRAYEGVAHTTLNGSITTASTSVILTSSGDFDESGSIDIAAESITEEVDAVAYTANTEATATLSGATGITANHATARDVWQGASFGLPRAYTVDNATITFDQPFANQYAGENIKGDYYAKLTRADSDGDVLDEPFAEIYISCLRWRIKKRKNQELKREEDDDYKEWVEKREAQVSKEFTGQDGRLIPDVPC